MFVSLVWAGPAWAQAPKPDGGGGGEFVFRDHAPHLTPEQRAAIWRELEHNIELLRSKGVLDTAALGGHPLMDWPLRASADLTDPGYHGVSNFVDQEAGYPNQLRDYNCGTRTYDTAGGYNHQGIDFFLWPFPWNKMDDEEVAIVAASAGTIVGKSDANYDRSCATSGGNWNAVYTRHGDGSIAWYGHMKNGSTTPKLVGEAVAAGEYLGIVGSSGNSTGPHLHLEVYDASGNLNEPYQGPCNAMNVTSWWMAQRPYYDSAINKMTTGYAPPDFGTCPNQGSANSQIAYPRGAAVYFTTYYRDQLSSQRSDYLIRRPNGTVFSSWSHNSPAPHYSASFWYWYWTSFAPSGPDGVWTFEVTYEGQTRSIPFIIGFAPSGRVADLTVTRAGADLSLDWEPSCLASDTDYVVYEGVLGDYYGHQTVTCSTGGATAYALSPAAGNSYYLVVPTNTTREGSHGLTSSGAERPVGFSVCRAQSIGGCATASASRESTRDPE